MGAHGDGPATILVAVDGSETSLRAGAYAAGARDFLAPADNCAEALQRPIKGLELIKMSNLTDALTALQDLDKGVTPPLCTK